MSVESAVQTVRRLGGTARTSKLRAAGVARADLAHAVREARLLRPRVGIYTLPETPKVVIEALSHCGAVACVTAGREIGLWILDDDGEPEPELGRAPERGPAAETDADAAIKRPHMWVSPRHRPTRVVIDPDVESDSCCVFHRDVPVDEPSLERVGVLHCLAQILRCRGAETFFTALESALRKGLIDERARRRLRQHLPSRYRWLVDFARSDADSGLESLLRLRLHRHGISLASQVEIPGVGRVDFVIGDCLILEADGGTHDGPARHRDRVRDAVAMALGFVTLRLDYALIIHDWELVENAILAAVRRNLHRSTAGLTW